jgi:mRNA interferase MazF
VSIPQRGDVWLVDFGTPVGHEQGFRRLAVVLSADRMNSSRAGLVIVVPITRSRRGLPSHVELYAEQTGLRETSYAKGEDIKSVSVDRLVHRLGDVPGVIVAPLGAAVRTLLDL